MIRPIYLSIYGINHPKCRLGLYLKKCIQVPQNLGKCLFCNFKQFEIIGLIQNLYSTFSFWNMVAGLLFCTLENT